MIDQQIGYMIYLQKCEQYELKALSFKEFLLQLTTEQLIEFNKLGTYRKKKIS